MRAMIILLLFNIVYICRLNANFQNDATYNNNTYNSDNYPEYPPVRPPRWCQLWYREFGADTYKSYRNHQIKYKRGGISLSRWSNYCYNMYLMQRTKKYKKWKEGPNDFTDMHWKQFLRTHCGAKVPQRVQQQRMTQIKAAAAAATTTTKPTTTTKTTTTTKPTTTTKTTTTTKPTTTKTSSTTIAPTSTSNPLVNSSPVFSSNWSNCSGPVRNQGSCGCCWAFCAAQITHTMCCINGTLIPCSEENYLDCNAAGYNCSSGGWMDTCWDYSIANHGSCRLSDYPFNSSSGTSGTCQAPGNKTMYNNISTYGYVSSTNMSDMSNQMCQYIQTNGPLCFGLDASGLSSYVSGVYSCQGKTSNAINHAVACMGCQPCPNATDGSICYYMKNSWGNNWGLGGYFWLTCNATSWLDCGASLYPMWSVCSR